MAIPPGNKQIGQVSVSAVSTEQSVMETAANLASFVVLKNSTAYVPPDIRVKNLMIGQAALTTISSVAFGNKTLTASSMVMLVALRYSAPVTLTGVNALTLLALKDAGAPNRTVPLNNVGVGNLAVSAVTTTTAPSVTMQNTIVLVAVRRFNPRHEHITMNIEYAANAKLNTEDLL